MRLTVLILLLYSTNSFAEQKCAPDFYKTIFYNGTQSTSVFILWFPIQSGSQYTTSLCSSLTGQPMQRYCFYNRTSKYGTWKEISSNNNFINCSSIDSTCKRQEFKHNYITKDEKLEVFNNHWRAAQITEIADLEEPCLDKTGLPITRKCLYNNAIYQAQWEPINGHLQNITCRRELKQSHIIQDLNNLYTQTKTDDKENIVNPKKVMHDMIQILATPQTVRVSADIKISSEILKIVTKDVKKLNIIPEVITVTNIMMNTGSKTIQTSEKVNATSSFLKTIDKYFDNMAKIVVPTKNCATVTDGVNFTQSEALTLFYVNPLCSNISGFAFYDFDKSSNGEKYNYDINTGYYYRFLYLNQSLDQLLTENHLRLATYFPLSLWQKLKPPTSTDDNSDTVLKFIIFKNDKLFPNQTKAQHQPIKKVLEISIPNYMGDLPEDLPFILSYKFHERKEKPVCGYWNDSTWLTNNVATLHKNINNRPFLLCQSTHLTHFAALMGVNSATHTVVFSSILENVSIAGCSLSLFGLIFIWLTAMCFKSWRSQDSNKVLLNMCLVLTLIMVFFLLLNLPDIRDDIYDIRNYKHCMIMGAFLHYSILVLFIWMLIIAIMQYQRYVQVLGVERPSNFILKFSLIAWGLPLIPTLLVAYLDPKTYLPSEAAIRDNTAICYPSGQSLDYGILLPVFVIILANLGLYVYVLWRLHRSLNKFQRQRERKHIIVQIRLSLLLFFLLGISWIFGMLGQFFSSSILNLLFCITSPLQGFVLFIYFIVIDKTSSYNWLKRCCGRKRCGNKGLYYCGEF